MDLQTGEEIYIKVGDEAVGDLTCSPDGSETAYASCHPVPNARGDFDIESSSIKIFSLAAPTSKTILEAIKRFLTIILEDGNHLIIYNYDYQANTPTKLR